MCNGTPFTVLSARGDISKPSIYTKTLDPAILKSVQDKLIRQSIKEIINIILSQPEILAAEATKEKFIRTLR